MIGVRFARGVLWLGEQHDLVIEVKVASDPVVSGLFSLSEHSDSAFGASLW